MRRPVTSPSALALVVAALLAVVQAALLAAILSQQRSSSHIVDISGMQRSQTQRIAVLALEARLGTAPADWRAQIEATIAGLERTRAEIAAYPDLRIERADTPPIRQLAEPYVAAARALEKNPNDLTAFTFIRTHQDALVAEFDGLVKLRVELLALRSDHLVLAIIVAVFVQLLVIGGSWLGIVGPAERRTRSMLASVTAQREQMQSFFNENPDAIGVYDPDGYLVRANRARAMLMGESESEQLGRHIDTFVATDSVAVAHEAFERVKQGESLDVAMRKKTAAGEIDVETTIFPNMIGGKLAGVVTVSRNVTELREAQRLYAEQRQRITDLYAVAAAQGKSSREQIYAALRLASERLGYTWGAALELEERSAAVIAFSGQPQALAEGFRCTLDIGAQIDAAGPNEVWSCDDLERSPYRAMLPIGLPFRAIAGAPIVADGRTFGVFGIASPHPRDATLSETDKDFLRLVAALLGSVIERDRREQRLNSLAYFDVLTGLPNRAMLSDRLDEAIHAARRRGIRLAVHYVDLDRFKDINDSFGHDAGDEVLRVTAQRLRSCVRDSDIVARLSGDEFVVVQAGSDGAEELARRILSALSLPCAIGSTTTEIGASVGIAYFPESGATPAELLRAADRALYEAKREGRGRYKTALRRKIGVA